MTQQSYRANITAAEFPFLSEFQGRTIIMPQIDQNYSRQANSPKNKDRDIGIPQAYYMHNVVPTDAGLTSVAYQTVAGAPPNTPGNMLEVNVLRDTSENSCYWARNTLGTFNYVLLNLGAGWTQTGALTPPPTGKFDSVAHVNGQTYVYVGGVGCYRYDFGLNNWVAVVLTGLVPAQIDGICASNGYLIAWNSNSVKWSSLTDPTDFTPSLVTGAGGQSIQQAKAAIVYCIPQNNGFVIYTKKNAIGMTYSNNSQYPFNAKEIIGAGGLSDPSLVAADGNSTNHYAYTTNGLQEISLNNSQIAFPQLTDFIAGAQFEDYDEATNTFTVLNLSVPMVKKLTLVANRYLVFSYGVSQLTHALVYDFALARWGKLKITHVDCFEYNFPSSDVVETPKRSIGFINAAGELTIAVISYSTTGSYGTVLLGKYQIERERVIEMQEIHIESVQVGMTIGVKLLTSLDGLNTSSSTPVLAESRTTYRRYNCRASGLNHSIVLTGAFNLNTMVLKFTDAGESR